MRKTAMPDTSFLMVWKVLFFGVSSVCILPISSPWENIHAPCGSWHRGEGTADFPPFLIQFSADNRKRAWKNAVGFYAYGVEKQEKGADTQNISALWACQYLIFWLRTAFPASENIDFTDFLHVFLLGGRERASTFCYMIIVIACTTTRLSITIIVSHILQLRLWSTDTIDVENRENSAGARGRK